jgi:orotate phosphoribosyltransferase-like protein
MKTIHADFTTIKYPVGDYIQYNIPIIKYMGDKIKLILIEKKLNTDAQINLICSGSSGAIIASIIATILYDKFEKVCIRYIKKDGENSHGFSYMCSEWFKGFNIIVDDFITTGATMKYIFNKINNNTKVDLIAVSEIDCDWLSINYLRKKKVGILLTK